MVRRIGGRSSPGSRHSSISSYSIIDIDQDDLAVVRLDARPADDVAVTIADCDDASAIRPGDDLADTSTGQFLVKDVVAVPDDADVIVAVDEGLVVDRDDRPVVLEFLDDLASWRRSRRSRRNRCRSSGEVPTSMRWPSSDVSGWMSLGARCLRGGVALGRRTLIGGRWLRRLPALLGRLFASWAGCSPGWAGCCWPGSAPGWAEPPLSGCPGSARYSGLPEPRPPGPAVRQSLAARRAVQAARLRGCSPVAGASGAACPSAGWSADGCSVWGCLGLRLLAARRFCLRSACCSAGACCAPEPARSGAARQVPVVGASAGPARRGLLGRCLGLRAARARLGAGCRRCGVAAAGAAPAGRSCCSGWASAPGPAGWLRVGLRVLGPAPRRVPAARCWAGACSSAGACCSCCCPLAWFRAVLAFALGLGEDQRRVAGLCIERLGRKRERAQRRGCHQQADRRACQNP